MQHERTARLLLKALAKGDLETVEHCALALVREVEDVEVHADYESEPLITCRRHLHAYLYGLPPFHRNPCRREIVEQRRREGRLGGCFVELAWKGNGKERTARGTIMEDRGDTWVVRVRQRAAHGTHLVEVPIVVPLDHLAACDVIPNPAQYAAHGLPPGTGDQCTDARRYLGEPDWPWFERLGPAIPHD